MADFAKGPDPTAVRILEVRSLEVRLRTTRDVLLHLERLEVACGEVVGLAGPAGAGKTITALAIMGLLPPSMVIAGGEVLFEGRDLLLMNERRLSALRGNRIALIFQSPGQALDPIRTCGIQLDEPLARHGRWSKAERRHMAKSALTAVAFNDPDRILDARPAELSGGERQRVLLAMSGLFKPSLLIADEPTSGLDPPLTSEFSLALRDMSRHLGRSALLISHDEDLLVRSTDRIVRIEQGRLSHRVTLAPSSPQPMPASTAENQGPILEAKGLRHTLGAGRQEVAALKDISISVGLGNAIGVIGASGAGKTTLARALVGLVKPEAGSVEFQAVHLRKGAGAAQLIYQDPVSSLNPRISIGDAVAEVLLLKGHSAHDARLAAESLLREVGLDAASFERFPNELSGGQCQLAAIARALAADPEVLVADEPTASLDQTAMAQVVAVLLALVRSRRVGLVLVSHDIRLIAAVCDQVIVLKSGEQVESGSTQQILLQPQHSETARLVESFRQSREK